MGVLKSEKKAGTLKEVKANVQVSENTIKRFFSKVEVRPMTKSEIKAARINSYSSIY